MLRHLAGSIVPRCRPVARCPVRTGLRTGHGRATSPEQRSPGPHHREGIHAAPDALHACRARIETRGCPPSTSSGCDAHDGGGSGGDLGAALRRYLALPGTKSYLIHAGPGGSLGRVAHQPGPLPVHRQRLQDLRARPVPARRRGGPAVRGRAAGHRRQRAHARQPGVPRPRRHDPGALGAGGDDRAQRQHRDRHRDGKVGADRVRALIAQAGLRSIRIPDTTRLFLSYISARRPAWTWAGRGSQPKNPPGPLRPPLNDVITLAGSARDFVSWYEQALAGRVLRQAGDADRVQAHPGHVRADRPGGAAGHARLRQGRGAAVPRAQPKSFAGQIVVGAARSRRR